MVEIVGGSPTTVLQPLQPLQTAKGWTEEAQLVAVQQSDFLTKAAPERKSARLSSALLNYKRPEGLNLVPLGSSWSLDVFARLHNGTRRELIDMYNMIDSMQKRVQELRSTDLKLFFDWWRLFASYLQVAFEAYDQVLVPWITKRVAMPPPVGNDAIPDILKRVGMLLKSFNVAYDALARRPPDETMAKIIKALADVHPIIEFMEELENSVPDLIEQHFTPRETLATEKRLAVFLHKRGKVSTRRMHLSIIARGMTDEVRSAWQRRIPAWVRFSYRAHSKKFEASHVAAAQRLT